MRDANLLPRAHARDAHASPDATAQMRTAPAQRTRRQRLRVPETPVALPLPRPRPCGPRRPGRTLNMFFQCDDEQGVGINMLAVPSQTF